MTDQRSRLQQLDLVARNGSGGYYTGVDARSLQREHLELLEREAVAADQLDVDRLAELDAMAASPASNYYEGPDAQSLQREHLRMLEAQEAGRATPDATPATIQQRTTIAIRRGGS